MRNALMLSLIATLAGIPVYAAGGSIGVATSVASYSINNSLAAGASNVPEGAQLATTTSPSEVRLESGTQLRLATRSSGAVYGDRMVLNRGAVWVAKFADYPVQTRNLTINGGSDDAQAIVRLNGNTVEVASLGGTVMVSDGGAAMTRVAAGTRMNFAVEDAGQAAAQPQTQTQTGANPNPPPPQPAKDTHTLFWTLVVVSAAAIVIGSIAAAQGKSPF